jgi:hypothetical protein
VFLEMILAALVDYWHSSCKCIVGGAMACFMFRVLLCDGVLLCGMHVRCVRYRLFSSSIQSRFFL